MQLSTKFCLCILIIFFSAGLAHAQKIIRTHHKSPIVCYASTENHVSHIPPPQAYLDARAARTQTANIEVVYNGFTPEAEAAFQFAVEIWEALITSPITIRVSANWTPLGAGVLGSAGPTFFAGDFAGAPNLNVFYPGALAEKLAGKELNDPTEFDINASFSSTFNWYLQSSGTPAIGQFDLISVVLHELGHGLGFVDTYNWATNTGSFGSFTNGIPFSFDTNIENNLGANLFQTFASPSPQLGTQLLSNNLFYNSPLATANNGGVKPKIYAPSPWNGGSSIAHLDEALYAAGNPNSLMSPQFSPQEVNHDPGPITLNMFKDLGWVTLYIDHEPIASTQNTASTFAVEAIITDGNSADYSLNTSAIFLNYYTSSNATVVTLPMTATGTPNEYAATLPAAGATLDYFYYISAGDNLSRTITSPGKINTALQARTQGYYTFHVGSDGTAPVINHTPKSVLSFLDDEIKIEAEVEEQLGLSTVRLEYSINDVPQSDVNLTLIDSEYDFIKGSTVYQYEVVLPIASFIDGDILSYKIVAVDNSSSSNAGASPASNFHTVTFKGIKAVQNSYLNTFNAASDDFIGDSDEFTISQPAGFADPAIHSVHPYPEAGNGNELNFIYTLRTPILVESVLSKIKFDEIVLIEPGEPNSVFGTVEFYDYVVVEGSLDGGENWTPLADGYDSRDFEPWLTRYNRTTPDSNGDPSLYRSREINLLDEFSVGDEILIRFRLFSDPGAGGWGWAVDNLKIQIDDEGPTVLHQHIDYVTEGTTELVLVSELTDNISIEKAIVEFSVNGQSPQSEEVVINESAATVTFNLGISSLSVDDVVSYTISATDVNGNTTTIPVEGSINVPILDFQPVVTQYANNFNAASDDFVGNFFSIDQPSGFSNGAIHSNHFYDNGFGPAGNSNFTYTLKKPITISAGNPFIRFDEIALVEGHASSAIFGTPAFNDYVIVEGSSDGGETWSKFLDGYDIVGVSNWTTTFDSNGNGTPSLFRTRTIDMTEEGGFAANDEVIIRFRLFSNEDINGWGWAIDNLYIQDAITGAETSVFQQTMVYPNPTADKLNIHTKVASFDKVNIQLMATQGKVISNEMVGAPGGVVDHTMSLATLPTGIYLLKISDGRTSEIRKVVKTN